MDTSLSTTPTADSKLSHFSHRSSHHTKNCFHFLFLYLEMSNYHKYSPPPFEKLRIYQHPCVLSGFFLSCVDVRCKFTYTMVLTEVASANPGLLRIGSFVIKFL